MAVANYSLFTFHYSLNKIMAKQRTAHAYELELRKMIKSRTGADMEAWLLPQVRATASNMVMLDKVQAELEATESLVTLASVARCTD